uniref:Uncharacterized protein n=1 Tax=Macaca fascicularis TaxID=9541 RepID=A0A7N9CNN8_MACFA
LVRLIFASCILTMLSGLWILCILHIFNIMLCISFIFQLMQHFL